MNIKYKKTFNLGNYESETIEVEATDVDLSVESFAKVKNLVEEMHDYSLMRSEQIALEKENVKKGDNACSMCVHLQSCKNVDKGKEKCKRYSETPF